MTDHNDNILPFHPPGATTADAPPDGPDLELLAWALGDVALMLRSRDVVSSLDTPLPAGLETIADFVTETELRRAVMVFSQFRRALRAALRKPWDPVALLNVMFTAMAADVEFDVILSPPPETGDVANAVRPTLPKEPT